MTNTIELAKKHKLIGNDTDKEFIGFIEAFRKEVERETLDVVASIIVNDTLAIEYQTTAQYRTFLVQTLVNMVKGLRTLPEETK